MYYFRVIAVKVILLLEGREEQSNSDNERFKQVRDTFLADGLYSMMSKALSLLVYSKHVAMNHTNAGSVA